MNKIMCCIVKCKEEAEWEVCLGNEVSDISEACTSHIGDLVEIGDSRGRKVDSFKAHRIQEREECPICHGEGFTSDPHDPCSNCSGKGYIG